MSEHLGVAFASVTVHQGDTSETPYAFGTGGSRTGPILGAAVQLASLELRSKIASIAAHQLEASPDDMEIADGVITVRGTPSKAKTVAEIAHGAYLDPGGSLPPGMEPGLEVIRRYQGRPAVPILERLPHVHCRDRPASPARSRSCRYVVSEDCGVMINPSVVEGQIAGGAVQGIGGALLEHFVYDADGNPLTTTFLDYLLPDRGRRPDARVRPHRDARLRPPATTRASVKAAPSGHRRRSPTPSTTRSPSFGRACSKRPSAPHASWPPWRQSDADRRGGPPSSLNIRAPPVLSSRSRTSTHAVPRRDCSAVP